MIPFQTPDVRDVTWVRPILESEGLALCNYSFPVLFCWKDAYGFQYAPLDRRLLIRLNSSLGHSYLWPVGEGDPTPALEALSDSAHAEGHPLRLIGLTLYHKNWLEAAYPGRFHFAEARDGFDYLYDIHRLADLPGKKLHASATTSTAWTRPAPAGPGPPSPQRTWPPAWPWTPPGTRPPWPGRPSGACPPWTMNTTPWCWPWNISRPGAGGHRPAVAGGDPGLHPGRPPHRDHLRRPL